MLDKTYINVPEEFENALHESDDQDYRLRLYVAGNTAKSSQAIVNIKKICAEELDGRYDLEVVDIYQQPEIASAEQIVAVPTLIKMLPLPLRRILGDLSDNERVLVGLNLRPKDH